MPDINESQKKVAIPYEEWDESWDRVFKREKQNDIVMRHKRKPKNEKDS